MQPHGIHSPLKITFYFSTVYICKYFIAKDSYCKSHSKIWEIPEIAYRRLFYILITYVPNWQKKSWQTFEEASRYMRPERVNNWLNFMTDI
jgi:hypothetical protein